ncbi:MAG TPA: XdhC family protein [Solirubrobacteraceae bacterium]|nr:XdhC family protein [Solirubrobacteraceae bacterium]
MTEDIAPAEIRAAWERESELHGPGFAEPEAPAPRIVLFGAVPLAVELCGLGRALGWRPYVVDPRERFAVADRFPGAEDVLVAWPEEAFARLGGIDAATAVLLLTHDPVLDDPALEIALRSDAMFVGAMGSRRTQASRRERLLAAGLAEEELARLSGPIGLDTGARTARETALAILAEIVAVRHGRDGGRLTAGLGPIHEVTA